MKLRINQLIAPVCAIILLTACSTPKNIALFPEVSNGTSIAIAESNGIVLKPNDKISIVVNTKSAELNNALNMPVSSQIIGYSEVQSTNQSRATSGYTIDANGNIDFPLIGMVKAAGFTRAELASSLKKILENRNVAKDAVVTVEFLNVGFSVLGEVTVPGFYPFENDKGSEVERKRSAGGIRGEHAQHQGHDAVACLHPPAERCGVCRTQRLPQTSGYSQRQRDYQSLVLAVGHVGTGHHCSTHLQVTETQLKNHG